jgi:hypothetical protein
MRWKRDVLGVTLGAVGSGEEGVEGRSLFVFGLLMGKVNRPSLPDGWRSGERGAWQFVRILFVSKNYFFGMDS